MQIPEPQPGRNVEFSLSEKDLNNKQLFWGKNSINTRDNNGKARNIFRNIPD